MSFSVSTEVQTAEAVVSAIEHAEPGAPLSDGQLALLRQGKLQAIAILESGVVGAIPAPEDDDVPARAFRVTITGHAAADTPMVGDVLSVSVNQVPFPTSPDAEPPSEPVPDAPPAPDEPQPPQSPVPPPAGDGEWGEDDPDRDAESGHPV